MHEASSSTLPVERGATSVEYALMVGLIAVVISGAVLAFGIQVGALFALVPPIL